MLPFLREHTLPYAEGGGSNYGVIRMDTRIRIISIRTLLVLRLASQFPRASEHEAVPIDA